MDVAVWYLFGPLSSYVGTTLALKYVPYTYMDPLGDVLGVSWLVNGSS